MTGKEEGDADTWRTLYFVNVKVKERRGRQAGRLRR